MKRLVYLVVKDPNPQDKKIKKNDLYILEEMARLLAIKEFKAQASILDFKVVKEYPTTASVVIEYPDAKVQEMYDALRALPIVETIDSILPKD